MAQVASPTITITGQGTAISTYLGSVTYGPTAPDRYGNYFEEIYDKWQIVCTPAAGWYLASGGATSRMEISHTYPGGGYSEVNNDTFPLGQITPPQSYSQTFDGYGFSGSASPSWYRVWNVSDPSTPTHEDICTSWTVNVVFTQAQPPPQFGDKLICDPNRGNKLCYDITTGKLLYGGTAAS